MCAFSAEPDTKVASTAQATQKSQEPQVPLEAISIFSDAVLAERPAWTWGRDPFLKVPGFAGKEEAPSIELRVSAIIYDKDNPAAMINGQIVRRGEVLADGSKISEIGTTYVVVEKGSSLVEVPVGASSRMPAGGAGASPAQRK
ncbi:MAG: hypothetical protein NDI61_11800 [Bdellovibrionaceae bacterium]|nr:hypothetical protein [Pseudobdellovibrionaceae bacterium]